MSGYLPKVKVTDLEFEADKVTCTLVSPHRSDVLRLAALIGPELAVQPGKELEVLDTFGQILPKYVQDFSGLTDAEGNAVGIEAVCSSFYFVHLMNDLGRRLVEVATPRPTRKSADS